MTKCLLLAVLGAPNAGKSTLVNQLVGQKVAIATPKVQTTRFRVRGIVMQEETQLVLVDTPGIFDAGKTFEKKLVKEAWDGAGDADALMVVVDSTKPLDYTLAPMAERMLKYHKPLCVVLNKIDQIKHKPKLLELAQKISVLLPGVEVCMVSALKGKGTKGVLAWCKAQALEGEWLFPEDQLTDLSVRTLAAEITREKLFLRLKQELPYSLTVEPESWEIDLDGVLHIHQAILVEREAHKKIIIGKAGDVLKAVGIAARREIEQLTDTHVRLELFVKVEPKWKHKPLLS